MKKIGKFAIITIASFGAGILLQRLVGIGTLMAYIGIPRNEDSQSLVCERIMRLQSLGMPEETIVFIGDSLIEQHEWHEVFAEHKIVNRGVSGSRIRDLIGAFDYSKSKAVFCLIGVNDLGQGISLEEFRDNYEILLASVGDGVRFHAISIPEIQRYRGLKFDADVLRQANTTIKELAYSHGFLFIDIFEASTKHKDKFFAVDGLHLSGHGYKEIANILGPYLHEVAK